MKWFAYIIGFALCITSQIAEAADNRGIPVIEITPAPDAPSGTLGILTEQQTGKVEKPKRKLSGLVAKNRKRGISDSPKHKKKKDTECIASQIVEAPASENTPIIVITAAPDTQAAKTNRKRKLYKRSQSVSEVVSGWLYKNSDSPKKDKKVNSSPRRERDDQSPPKTVLEPTDTQPICTPDKPTSAKEASIDDYEPIKHNGLVWYWIPKEQYNYKYKSWAELISLKYFDMFKFLCDMLALAIWDYKGKDERAIKFREEGLPEYRAAMALARKEGGLILDKTLEAASKMTGAMEFLEKYPLEFNGQVEMKKD